MKFIYTFPASKRFVNRVILIWITLLFGFNVPVLKGQIYTETNENWSNTLTWSSGALPTNSDNVALFHDVAVSVTTATAKNIIQFDKNLTLDAGSELSVCGDWDVSTLTANTNSTVTFSGSIQQNIESANTFDILEINNSNGIVLQTDIQINNKLKLSDGYIDLNGYKITMSDNAIIEWNYIDDEMIIADNGGEVLFIDAETNNDGPFNVPLATSLPSYNPVSLITATNRTNRDISFKISQSKHPDDNSPDDFLNIYWVIDISGTVNWGQTDVTCEYDQTANVVNTETDLYMARYNAGWELLVTADSGNDRLLYSFGSATNPGEIAGINGAGPIATSVSFTSDNDNNTSLAKEGDVITLDLTFNEDLNAAPTIEFNYYPPANSYSPTVSGSGATWAAKYTVIGTTAEEEFSFTVSGIEGLRSNTANDITTYAEDWVTVDRTSPTLSPVKMYSKTSTPDNKALVGEKVTLVFDASEEINGTPSVSFWSGGTPVDGAGFSISSNPANDSFTASYDVHTDDDEGRVSFAIDFADPAGNQGTRVTTTTNGSYVDIDKSAAPLAKVTMESDNPNNKYYARENDNITFYFTAAEPLSSTDPTLTIEGTTNNATHISGNKYYAEYTVDNDDTQNAAVEFTIEYEDADGLTGKATSVTAGEYVTIDYTAPSIYVTTIETGDFNIGSTVETELDLDGTGYSLTSAEINNIEYPDAQLQFISEAGNDVYTVNYQVRENDKIVRTADNFTLTYTMSDQAGNSVSSGIISQPTTNIYSERPSAYVSGKTTLCAGENVTFAIDGGEPDWEVCFDKIPSSGETCESAIATSPYEYSGETGTGTFEITSVKDNYGNQSTDLISPFQWTVRSLPEVDFYLDETVYQTDEVVDLTSSNPDFHIAPDETGDFSGKGIDNTQKQFIADVAGIGEHTITYTYEDNFGCIASDDETVLVIEFTTYITDFDNTYKHYCRDATDPDIIGVTDATFPYDAVILNWHPTLASHPLQGNMYLSTDLIPGVFTFWDKTNTTQLDATALNNYGTEQFSFTPSDYGFLNAEDTVYLRYRSMPMQFDAYNPYPSNFLGTTLELTEGYFYDVSEMIVIEDINTPIFVAPTSDFTSCKDESAVLFIGQDQSDFPNGEYEFEISDESQTFTATTTPNNGYSVGEDGSNIMTLSPNLVPETAGEFRTYTITLTYTSELGKCTSAPATEYYTVGFVPSPDISNVQDGVTTYNRGGNPQTLIGSPDSPGTGAFSGSGVSGNQFDPSGFVNNSTTKITYEYTSAVGCAAETVEDVQVTDAKGKIVGLSSIYCYSNSVVDFEYDPDGSGITESQIISIESYKNAVTSNSGFTAQFDIAASGDGIDTVKVTYEETGEEFTLKKTILIDSIGEVNFNIDEDYCANDTVVTIFGQFDHPAGAGRFSSSAGGFANLGNYATFDPSTTSPGGYDINFRYESNRMLGNQESSCYKERTKTTEVNAIPQVSIIGLDDTYNVNGDPVTLKGNKSPQGSFSGQGVSFGVLYPNAVGVKTGHPVTYSYTDPATGCANSVTQTVDIRDAIGKISNLEEVYCYVDSVIEIQYVPDESQPVSGSFSSAKGGLISSDDRKAQYSLNKAGAGSDTIWYTYTLDNVKFVLQETVYIDSIGEVDFDVDSSYCADHPLVNIGARFSHPQGQGTFSTPAEGFENYGNTASINPSEVPTSLDPYILTYTYHSKIPGSTCQSSASKPVAVYPVPEVSFTIDENYNIEDDPVVMEGTPDGGSFSGPGVSGNTFYPAIAGKGFDYVISYTYIDSLTGCGDSYEQKTNVLEADAEIQGINMNNTYCYDDNPDTLTGVSINGLPGGEITGNGTRPIGPDMAIFTPSEAGAGNHTIKYSYTSTDGVTQFVISEELFVDSLGDVSISGLDEAYCRNDEEVQIFGSEGSRGSFSGPGIIPGAGSAYFYPSLAGSQDSPHEIIFEFTSEESGCKSIAKKTVTVHDLPDVSFEIKEIYNISEEPDTLYGIPVGGDFSGRGIIALNNTFHPDLAGIGSEITVSYSFTDKNGCTSTTSKSTSVKSAAGQIIGINQNNVYCYNDINDTLIGIPENGLPGGNFTGKGILNISPDTAIFNPQTAGKGEHQVIYSYKAEDNQTEFEIETFITVDSVGQVFFVGLDEDYCADEEQFQLTAIAPPGGRGDFSGLQEGFINAGNTAFISPAEITPSDEPYVINYRYISDLGCSSSSSDSFIINNLPSLSFEIDSAFCANDNPVLFQGIPAGGFFSGPNVDNLQNRARFTPDPAIVGSNNLITYSYTDSVTGCSNEISKTVTVNEVAEVAFSDFDNEYCKNQPQESIIGLVNGFEGFGDFSGNGIQDETPGDGLAAVNPSDLEVGDYTFTFQYTNQFGCTGSVDTSLTIHPIPTLSLGGLNQEKSYCQYKDAEPVILEGLHSGSGGVGKYYINNEELSANILDPAEYTGTISIRYEYTDENGCFNDYHDTVTINPVPRVDFEVKNFCLPEIITIQNKSPQDQNIETWLWDFGDGISQQDSTYKNIVTHAYFSAGLQSISLSAVTDKGCEADTLKRTNLSRVPDIDFLWENECLGSGPVNFEAITSDNIASWNWEFGDGNTNESRNPSHNYQTEGAYNVILTAMEAVNNCPDTAEHMVYVRPTVTLQSTLDNQYNEHYTEDFESQNTGWINDINENLPLSSWKLGLPDGEVINTAASGSNAWFTDLPEEPVKEKSWVSSPCFDFSSLKKPMIKLNIWSHPNSDRDGAVLQYQDDGEWINIGTINSGVNWYNTAGILGNPGNQEFRQEGWSGVKYDSWIEARHKLDMLSGKKDVILRIAYGSEGGVSTTSYDGFAFDDIWIGERTKKILVEHFTNSSCLECVEYDNEINAIANSNAKDIVDIQYHTSYPGEDPMNKDNVQAPSARSLYYGISDVPNTIVDGNTYKGKTKDLLEQVQILEKRILQDPAFDIELITNASEGTINFQADVTALKELADISVYIAIYEKEIHLTGANGQTKFENVLKKMHPDAGGTQFRGVWSKNEQKSVTGFWKYENVYDPANLYVAAFVQNDKTKEVYQVVTSDTTDISTGVNRFMSSVNDNIKMYPNPVNKILHILFKEQIAAGYQLNIYNELGKLLSEYQLEKGTKHYEISTQNLPYGIYFMELSNSQQTKTLKFIKIE